MLSTTAQAPTLMGTVKCFNFKLLSFLFFLTKPAYLFGRVYCCVCVFLSISVESDINSWSDLFNVWNTVLPCLLQDCHVMFDV